MTNKDWIQSVIIMALGWVTTFAVWHLLSPRVIEAAAGVTISAVIGITFFCLIAFVINFIKRVSHD